MISSASPSYYWLLTFLFHVVLFASPPSVIALEMVAVYDTWGYFGRVMADGMDKVGALVVLSVSKPSGHNSKGESRESGPF